LYYFSHVDSTFTLSLWLLSQVLPVVTKQHLSLSRGSWSGQCPPLHFFFSLLPRPPAVSPANCPPYSCPFLLGLFLLSPLPPPPLFRHPLWWGALTTTALIFLGQRVLLRLGAVRYPPFFLYQLFLVTSASTRMGGGLSFDGPFLVPQPHPAH